VSVGGVSYVQGLDSGEYDFTHVVATITASGSTTIYTPSSGRRIRLRWVYALNDPGSSASPLIKIFLGAEEKFRVYAVSKRQWTTGPVDGALIINLSEAAEVAVTVLLEEI
jgi:hypothetical protein